jgi:aryl-alcohol dehydrogenase-like predicted oxidoreductase
MELPVKSPNATRLCLGTSGFASLSQPEVDALLGTFADRGGHFLELGVGVPEERVGRAIQGKRTSFVLGAKFTDAQRFDASLRRLGVDSVEVLWIHGWKGGAGLDALAETVTKTLQAGKARSVGLADAPAWATVQLNARVPLSAQIVEYGLAARDAERELLPMARALGLKTLGWGTLAGDWFLDKQRARIDAADDYYVRHRKAAARKLAPLTARLAKAQGVAHEALLIRWVLERGVTALLGATTVESLERRLTCLDFALTDQASAALDEASRIDLGFPHTFG